MRLSADAPDATLEEVATRQVGRAVQDFEATANFLRPARSAGRLLASGNTESRMEDSFDPRE